MIAAAILSLLLPSIDASEKLFTSELAATLWVLFGVFLGVVFLLIINALTPHEHADQTYEGPEIEVKSGIWLFVLAIIIHNIPEGLAMGISFSADRCASDDRYCAARFSGRAGRGACTLHDQYFSRESRRDRSIFRFDGAGRRFIRREFSGRPGICLSAGFGLVGRSHDVCGFP